MAEEQKTKEQLIQEVLASAAYVANNTIEKDGVAIIDLHDIYVLKGHLAALSDYIKQATFEDGVENHVEKLIVPLNVMLTLKQYNRWGINPYDFEAVEKACAEFSDFDVLEFLVCHRPLYKFILKQIFIDIVDNTM